MLDYKRLFGGLIVLLLVQWGAEAIIYPYVRTISQAILATALVDYLCSLSLNIFYVPKGYRISALKTPEFHRQVLTYFLIFFVVSLINMFLF